MPKTVMSTDQVHSLHHTIYQPKNKAKATLLIVHGMTEHSGRYAEFSQYLADHDIAVLAYDQLGHGRSIRNADELGFFSKSHPVQTLLKDVILMADKLKLQYPDVPHFIMGHSMGSFIVRNVLQVHNSEFAGAIIMGSSDYNPLVKAAYPITKTLNKLQPHRHNSVLATGINKFLRSQIKDKSIKSDYAWLCNNPKAIAEYESDPLCGFDFTNNGFWTLVKLMDTGLAKNWAETIEHDFPMLLISGDDDPVGNMGKGIRKLYKRMKKQGFEELEMKLYTGMRHEPLHEVESIKVLEDLLFWIDKNIV
ncbi:alpha/beta fold hydrolase [Psychrobacter sp.]|uniref:alpha/beta fold hydrolase n=1 Tax=Psychrobacter sp. TaxID=56811 RepID=UPI0025D10AB6|nr:alpha/beta fold hydrolase [Psychrobacter sp.]